MGISLMNVNAFAMPFAAYDNPANYGLARWPDLALWAAEFVLVDGKLRAIFSALFGASLLLVAERTAAAGRDAARYGRARLAILLLFGIAHACLIWVGDILMLYALVGFVALPLRRLEPERLVVLAGMMLVLQAGILLVNYQGLEALARAAAAPQAPAGAIALWRDTLDTLGPPSPAALAADLRLHRGAWTTLAAGLSRDAPDVLLAELLFTGPETLGLMLLGMAGLKSGFLTGAWSHAAYARTARIAYLVGLPPLVASAAWLLAAGTPPLLTATVTDLGALPFRWAVAIGHCALLMPWLAKAGGQAMARLTAVGRAAFTNYLGTSLLMTFLFDGWGFGLYGRAERWLVLPLVFAAWAMMLGWSGPWLRRFRHGPLEWAWRSLANGRAVPLRRQVAIANSSHPQ